MTMAKGIMIVDGQRVPFDGEKNVLSVIRKAGIDMPTFCYYSELSVHGACRMCIVENVKTGKIDASCSMEPRDGLEIRTNTARLLRHRRMILELMLASHDCSCTTCAKSGNCRLQALAQRFGVSRVRFPDTRERYEQDNTSPAIFRDPNKCILCGDCVRVCEELQGQGILNYAHRGSELQVMPAFDKKLDQTKCVGCGQCAAVCTTGAITVKNQIGQAWQALHDPKYLHNISSCKSPMEMFAAVLRDKYREKDAADGRRTYHVAIMPCTAKKMEAARPEFTQEGRPDVDLVITTRELVDMIREAGIQLTELEPEAPDLPFGLGSGAAVIYGVTGGVAEAVVRYCLPDKSNNALQAIRVTDLRGDGAIREVNLTVEGQELHLAIVNGLSHAKELIADVEAGKRFYHLVEVMTCQGGCVGGAGQPYGLTAAKKRRGAGLYEADSSAMFKRAEKNPIVTRLLEDYGPDRCHELLHVHYGE